MLIDFYFYLKTESVVIVYFRSTVVWWPEGLYVVKGKICFLMEL